MFTSSALKNKLFPDLTSQTIYKHVSSLKDTYSTTRAPVCEPHCSLFICLSGFASPCFSICIHCLDNSPWGILGYRVTLPPTASQTTHCCGGAALSDTAERCWQRAPLGERCDITGSLGDSLVAALLRFVSLTLIPATVRLHTKSS